ncbi:VWA domain-containing protein [Lentzea sp. NPDC042327]|uniref:VWA domain-containing protein n=1 Tax=Lentzea sp. NPDC042327 TaxID=3154801 RepID=UPI0033EB834E
MTDMERWRLILGEPSARCAGGLRGEAARRDAALEWLYGRDPELAQRGVRKGGNQDSVVQTVDWLDEVHALFPKETVERLERDAVERYEITDIVTDPEVLQRIEPNAALLRAVLRTKHLMNPAVLAMARKIVEAVVRQLVEKLKTEVRQAFSGTRSRRPSIHRNSRNFDFRATIRANLQRYRPDERKLSIEHAKFFSRNRKHIEQWQVVLLVDQSGSMTGSVIHSAVTAACLWGLPGLRTHLIAFDTNVVDLTSDVTDPVELLMKVQLGGGTDIAKAAAYGAGLVDSPRRAVVAIISDFYEGGNPERLVRVVKDLCEQGTHVLCLAALDEQANPDYDRVLGQRLANAGAHVGAMTPGELAEFVAEKLR